MTDVFYLLVCRQCGDDLPIPFATPAERGRWASQHTKGTGHNRWWVHDGDLSPDEVPAAIAEHDRIADELLQSLRRPSPDARTTGA